MNPIPDQVTALLESLVTNLQRILGAHLFGIYLYGSLTQKAFDPERSDIDLIVVMRRDLSETQFKKLDAWLKRSVKSNPWTTQMQMLFLRRDEVLTMNAKACLYQFGKLNRGSSDGNPIPWINILKSGVVLYGDDPVTFVPKITHRYCSKLLFVKWAICEKRSSKNSTANGAKFRNIRHMPS